MDNEIWKDISGYDGLYQVSDMGKIKSCDKIKINSRSKTPFIWKGRHMNPTIDKDGYLMVTLNGRSKKIHKLVAMTFLGHKPNGMKEVVDHINNIKTDNRVENLQLTTVRHNVSKDRKNKTSKYTGVHLEKESNKWRATIMIDGIKKHIGLYTNELEAHQAYQQALIRSSTINYWSSF